MLSQVDDRQVKCRAARAMQVCGIFLLGSLGVATAALAAPGDTDWRVETQIYLSGISNYVEKDDATLTFNTVAATAELKISSRARPYYAGLFVDYRSSTDRRFTDLLSLGGYVEYSLRNWDATTYLFFDKSPRSRETWHYAGRLRYRVAENHKFGVVASGSFSYPGSPALALGYFGSISDSLSLNVLADPGFSKGPDFAAQVELVWQIK